MIKAEGVRIIDIACCWGTSGIPVIRIERSPRTGQCGAGTGGNVIRSWIVGGPSNPLTDDYTENVLDFSGG